MTTPIRLSGADVVRFNGYVNRAAGQGGCWTWTGGIDKDGYGSFKVNGKILRAHRVACSLKEGVCQSDLMVLHSCHNPSCCNPDHLRFGTARDNTRDMLLAGRAATGEKSGPRKHPERLARGDRNGSRTHPERLRRGENHPRRQNPGRFPSGDRCPNTKILSSDMEIVFAKRSEGWSQQRIADLFGVSQVLIGKILRGAHRAAETMAFQSIKEEKADG